MTDDIREFSTNRNRGLGGGIEEPLLSGGVHHAAPEVACQAQLLAVDGGERNGDERVELWGDAADDAGDRKGK